MSTNKTNSDIRKALRTFDVKQWELAAALGYSEAWFCRKMRTELTNEEREEAIAAILKIAKEREE